MHASHACHGFRIGDLASGAFDNKTEISGGDAKDAPGPGQIPALARTITGLAPKECRPECANASDGWAAIAVDVVNQRVVGIRNPVVGQKIINCHPPHLMRSCIQPIMVAATRSIIPAGFSSGTCTVNPALAGATSDANDVRGGLMILQALCGPGGVVCELSPGITDSRDII